MKGITFVGYHSYKDLHLLLNSKVIGSPEVKKQKIDIPGADGDMDLTDFFGEPKYENVQHKFEFSTIRPHAEFLSQYSAVKNAIHGKKGRIILDGDPSFFYTGRCSVSEFTDEKGIGKITVTCDCEPYKYKQEMTVVSKTIIGTETITLTNARKRAVPTITTTADMTISFGGGIWTNRAGTFTIPELELVEGENIVAVTGTGAISFTWREAVL